MIKQTLELGKSISTGEKSLLNLVKLLVSLHADPSSQDSQKLVKQGPWSNFWIEGAECLAFQGRGGGWGNNRVPILASFFFNFFPFFFNYLAVATCSCLLLGFFSFFISKYWKKYMYVISTQSFASFCWMSECVFPKSQPKC